MIMENNACDLELSLFMLVELMCRLVEPLMRTSLISSLEATISSCNPSTYVPFLRSSLICKLTFELLN